MRAARAAALAALGLIAACSSPPGAAAGPGQSSPPHPARSPGTSPASAAPSTTPAPAPQVIVIRVRTADGSLVTVATFHGPVRYVLHNGSQDPGQAAARLVSAGPVISPAERPRLLAAFNGGFALAAGDGGYEQEGHVITPLRSGLASLVIDRSGQARIGIWGRGVPAPGEAVYSVRQNLPPLVDNGQPVPAAADWTQWGTTLGGGEYVARSALAQDGSGDLSFAASMSTTPADLAAALVRTGARIAMELDINPEWVQLDTASRPGAPLAAAVPGQVRPGRPVLRRLDPRLHHGPGRDGLTTRAARESGRYAPRTGRSQR